MERLLRFAVEHDRVIRLMFMRDGRLFQVNAHIVSYDDKQQCFSGLLLPEALLLFSFHRLCYSCRGFRACGRDQRARKQTNVCDHPLETFGAHSHVS